MSQQETRLYAHTLPNGLQLLGQYMPAVQSAAAIYRVDTGTRDEVRPQMGISHFLEHMAFRRTEHWISADMDRAFEEMGATNNAVTMADTTMYSVKVLKDNLSPALDMLTEIPHPVLDADDFDQERKIILEEIARYADLPGWQLNARLMEDYFGLEHPLSMDILGTPQTIEAMTVEQMRQYWRRRYGTNNMLFAIAGNFDWDGIVAQLEGLTRGWEPGETGRSARPAPFQPSFNVHPYDRFTQEHIALATPSVSRRDPRRYPAALLSTVPGDATGSRLFWAVYQEGMAETVEAYNDEFDDNGVLTVVIVTEPSLAAEALRITRAEMQKVQSFDLTEEELDRAKAKLSTSIIIGGESTEDRVIGLTDSWLNVGRLETLEEIRQNIERVTLNDIRELVADYPIAPDQVITAVGPLTEEELRTGLE